MKTSVLSDLYIKRRFIWKIAAILSVFGFVFLYFGDEQQKQGGRIIFAFGLVVLVVYVLICSAMWLRQRKLSS
jgi:hypothetical protein